MQEEEQYEQRVNDLVVNLGGQSMGFKMCSFARPHMRAFHLSWIGFFCAFTAWFAIAPLYPPIIETLGLTKAEVGNANIASIASTIAFRVFSGPLVDKFGCRRVFGILLIAGSIPSIFSSLLVRDGISLAIMRFLIGVIGSVFVPCQMWTTVMFAPSIVGSANAMVGGWGNLGGGFTFILMPQVFKMFEVGFGLNMEQAWRASLAVPGCICLIVAFIILKFGDDYPTSYIPRADPAFATQNLEEGTTLSGVKANGKAVRKEVPLVLTKSQMAGMIFKNHNIGILCLSYAACFGVELAFTNILGMYFIDTFDLDIQTGSLVASLFGITNLFARACGGFMSDFLFKKFQLPGRLLFQVIALCGEGGLMLLINAQKSLGWGIFSLFWFGMFTQLAEGSTYSIVPFVDKRITGTVAGLVGAAGNAGGVMCAAIFKAYGPDQAMKIIAVFVLSSGVLAMFLKVANNMPHYVFIGKAFAATKQVAAELDDETVKDGSTFKAGQQKVATAESVAEEDTLVKSSVAV